MSSPHNHYHFYGSDDSAIHKELLTKLGKLIMSVNAIEVQLDAISAQLDKVFAEVTTASTVQTDAIAVLQKEVADLQAGGAIITPAIQASIASLQNVAAKLDALNPDAVVPAV